VLLQEVQGAHRRRANRIMAWPDSSQYEFLAERHWPSFYYGKNAAHSFGHHGNAILSCFPLTGCENVVVSPYPFAASRGILHAIAKHPAIDEGLHVLCVHFGFIGFERRRQISRLYDHIAGMIPGTAPIIVAGDFNDWSGKAIEDSRIGLQEAFKELHGENANTWPSWAPLFPMDRIYFRGLKPVSAKRLAIPPWPSLSDHLPLQATFRI
jgi:endonuclease/exonuclease/phosphatase family metal-dependent hydrolase